LPVPFIALQRAHAPGQRIEPLQPTDDTPPIRRRLDRNAAAE
jgi:hypothetical protein